MTKPMTFAQQAQQRNRDDTGKYQSKDHSEADTVLKMESADMEEHEIKGKHYLEQLRDDIGWSRSNVEYTEHTVRQPQDYIGVEPGSVVRSLRFNHPEHSSYVEIEQITLKQELAEQAGVTDFQQSATFHNAITDQTKYDSMEHTYHSDEDLAGMTREVKDMLAELKNT